MPGLAIGSGYDPLLSEFCQKIGWKPDMNIKNKFVFCKSSIIITAIVGDITQQPDCDVIVNAANPQLCNGSGVCGAIHRAAGPALEVSAVRLGPINVGDAVITPGYNLPNQQWVIHVVGPRYAIDSDPPKLLAQALRNALELADARKFTRIAIPAISTGVYGYPIEQAGQILVSTARAMAVLLNHVKEIRFVLFSDRALDYFR